VCHVHGEIDICSERTFAAGVSVALISGTDAVVLDLSAVTFMGAAALHTLLRGDRFRTGGRAVKVIVGPACAPVLELARAESLFDCFPDRIDCDDPDESSPPGRPGGEQRRHPDPSAEDAAPTGPPRPDRGTRSTAPADILRHREPEPRS
jgi:anti-anti-sigma factor